MSDQPAQFIVEGDTDWQRLAHAVRNRCVIPDNASRVVAVLCQELLRRLPGEPQSRAETLYLVVRGIVDEADERGFLG